MRVAADPHEGLADDTVDRERPESIAYAQRTPGEGGAVARGREVRRARRRYLAPAAPQTRETGWRRRVERVGACATVSIELARNWGSARSSSPGVSDTSRGRTTPATGPRRRWSRWIPVISAPDSVVGIAATARRDRRDRLRGVDHRPPPRPTSGPAPARPSSAAAAAGTWPGSPGGSLRPRPQPRRVAQRPSVLSRSKAPESVLVEQLRRSLDPVPAEDDDPVRRRAR